MAFQLGVKIALSILSHHVLIILDDFYESKPVGYTLRGSFIGKYAQICANIGKDKQREASSYIKLNTDDFG